ncbi:MAG: hypothetical protein LBQ57_09105 [Spirochaetales bacterium]|jgi:hypothetical protein|nr:hypothetical protein [Spirochaetales bacterium]
MLKKGYWLGMLAFLVMIGCSDPSDSGEAEIPQAITVSFEKLFAVRWKDGVDLGTIEDLDNAVEDDFSDYYTVVYDFGEKEITTALHNTNIMLTRVLKTTLSAATQM